MPAGEHRKWPGSARVLLDGGDFVFLGCSGSAMFPPDSQGTHLIPQ